MERKNLKTSSHRADKSGKSKIEQIEHSFKSGDHIIITCTDWAKKMNYPDNLRVSLSTKELLSWINTKAYK